jgi:hypothetical protein
MENTESRSKRGGSGAVCFNERGEASVHPPRKLHPWCESRRVHSEVRNTPTSHCAHDRLMAADAGGEQRLFNVFFARPAALFRSQGVHRLQDQPRCEHRGKLPKTDWNPIAWAVNRSVVVGEGCQLQGRGHQAVSCLTTPVLSPWRSASTPRPCNNVSQTLHRGVSFGRTRWWPSLRFAPPPVSRVGQLSR